MELVFLSAKSAAKDSQGGRASKARSSKFGEKRPSKPVLEIFLYLYAISMSNAFKSQVPPGLQLSSCQPVICTVSFETNHPPPDAATTPALSLCTLWHKAEARFADQEFPSPQVLAQRSPDRTWAEGLDVLIDNHIESHSVRIAVIFARQRI